MTTVQINTLTDDALDIAIYDWFARTGPEAEVMHEELWCELVSRRDDSWIDRR